MARRSVKTTSLAARPTPSLRGAPLDGLRRTPRAVHRCGGCSRRAGFPTDHGILRRPSEPSDTASGVAALPGGRPPGTSRPAHDLLSHAARCPTAFRGGVYERPQPAVVVPGWCWPARGPPGDSAGAVRSRPQQPAPEERAAVGFADDPGLGQAGVLRLPQQRDRVARLREHRASIVARSARRGRRSRRSELLRMAATPGGGDQSVRRTAGR